MSEGINIEAEDGEKLPREFYEGVLSIKNALDDIDVPKSHIDMTLDSIEEAILDAMEHSGEEDDEDDAEDGE